MWRATVHLIQKKYWEGNVCVMTLSNQTILIFIASQVKVMFGILNSYYVTLVIIDFVPLLICHWPCVITDLAKAEIFLSQTLNINTSCFQVSLTHGCLNKQTKTSKEILACFSSAHVTENFIFSNQCQHENMFLPLLTEKPVLSNTMDS